MQEAEKAKYTGRLALIQILQHFGVGVEEIEVQCPEDTALDWGRLRRAARHYSLRAQLLAPAMAELPDLPVPSLVRLQNGHYASLAVCRSAVIILLDPTIPHPLAMPFDQFASIWDGEVMVFSARWSWAHFKQKYNLPWFMQIIGHYKKYLAEVLVAAFFLQLMGIGMPLITQVIIDKVIGNQGFSTLKVIGCSMVLFFFLQALLTAVKTYLLADTTNKLDAILGSRLIRHLVSLPLPYYESRRAGDILMRVEALTSIREFLTGEGLMTVLDVLFSVVFIAFMLYYSVPLTGIALLIIPLYILQNFWAMPRIQRRIDAVWRTGSLRQSFLVESVANVDTIKSLALEPQFNHRWEGHVARNIRASYDNAKLRVVLGDFSSLTETIASLGILWYGGHLVMDGVLPLGQLIAFQMIAGRCDGTKAAGWYRVAACRFPLSAGCAAGLAEYLLSAEVGGEAGDRRPLGLRQEYADTAHPVFIPAG